MVNNQKWRAWNERKKGVFSAAFAMGLPDPEGCVDQLDNVIVNDLAKCDVPQVYLARNDIDLTDEQFMGWWPAASVINIHLPRQPSEIERDTALLHYRALQKQTLPLPVIAWQQWSSPAKLAWPVVFVRLLTEGSTPENSARLADQYCLPLEDKLRGIDYAEYFHHARPLFPKSEFESWYKVQKTLSGDMSPTTPEDIQEAVRAMLMAGSDFS